MRQFIRKTIYYSLYVQVRILGFFSNTRLGYSLYLFSVSMLFAHPLDNFWMACNVFFVYSMCNMAFEMLFLLKIPFTRRYLEALLGAEFIKQHLDNSGVQSFTKLVAPIFGLGVLHEGLKKYQKYENRERAEFLKQKTEDVWRDSGHVPTLEDRTILLDKRLEIANKETGGLMDVSKAVTDLWKEGIDKLFN